LFVFIIFCAGVIHIQAKQSYGLLKVTPNGHYLQYEDGTPFFWLGDTGWELFHRTTLEEAVKYLDNRKSKGFNVIQAVIISELDGIKGANKYGEVPLLNADPGQPNEKYFQFVDTIIAIAAQKGMIMALLPAWGDKVTMKYGGTGPAIFNTETAYTYGKYLGNRYKRFNNIVWILGGDRPPQDDKEDWKPVYRKIAAGIKDGSDKPYLMTFHPGGYVWESSVYLHNEGWLDFNMIQSGHAELDQPVWKNILRDWHLEPTKPVIDGEPCYEDHPINPWRNWTPAKGYFTDYDVRRQIYRSVFSGGFGVTYGHHSIWQFYQPGVDKISYVDKYWYDMLDRPASFEAGYLKKLVESRPYINRIPDTSIIIKGQGVKADYIAAFRDSAGRYMMIYIPEGKTITVNTSFIPSKKIKATWFNPKTGKAITPAVVSNKKQQNFTPPATGKGNDWVLVLDNIKENFPDL
ncbi:MAG: glycoside hydrolase family 140 protein, partial [Chitinophagaceae bacterium]|nr:glycoside hydrolase family 140 protein [Chitinophagaceae bacterium]